MPSLVRMLTVLVILAAAAFAGLWALATFVHPVPRQMEQAIPASRFK